VPFCPAKNVTQRLILAMEGRFEASEVFATTGSFVNLASQTRRVQALRAYLDLLKDQDKSQDHLQ
jgi:hypothetical protein